jgi:hypothetical protein
MRPPVATVHPVRRIMPFLIPSKNGGVVLFEQQVPVAAARAFLRKSTRTGRPSAPSPSSIWSCAPSGSALPSSRA